MSRWDIDVCTRVRGRLDGSDGESNAFLNVTCMYLVLLIAVRVQGLRFARESKVFAEVRSTSVSRHTLPLLSFSLFAPMIFLCPRDLTISRQANINNTVAFTVLARPEGKRGKRRRNLRATLDSYFLDSAVGENLSFTSSMFG